ncbi:MAG: ABC transporter ATP-binding protein, partial [Clostridia bacterium]|nr:ABC transporter ATP-binding protein [Clostridia bacterium]
MAFTELRSVGKIYVNEEKASVGIRGIDLSFERGEFVAITGQSGSGKTTLLNVISGMDSYEEGELLIDSQPTSHLTQSDWERVRERYISFIFQDYNIVDSFTVLKNVELALLGTHDKAERRKRALELIRRVGLEEHINSRGSQLSGGQKQRAVIARALAKNSPIILADEPTGNLDAATSKEIISLLHSVSEDKLVIVVTHDFAEVTEYATRHIRMFDGAVEFDKRLSEPRRKNAEGAVNPEDSAVKAPQDTGAHAPINGTDAAPAEQAASDTPAAHHSESLRAALELGLARFTSMPRLSVMISAAILSSALILTLVLSLLTPVILFFSYTENHTFFQYDGRVVICRKDGATLSESELSELAGSLEAKTAVRYDFILDGWMISESTAGRRSFEIASPAESYTPDYGRLPEAAGEIMLRLPIGDIER